MYESTFDRLVQVKPVSCKQYCNLCNYKITNQLQLQLWQNTTIDCNCSILLVNNHNYVIQPSPEHQCLIQFVIIQFSVDRKYKSIQSCSLNILKTELTDV